MLCSSQVIFSAGGTLTEFEANSSRLLEAFKSNRLGFYVINDGTAQGVLANSSAEVFLSTVSNSGFDLSDGEPLNIEWVSGDASVSLSTQITTNFLTLGSRLQGTIEVIDLTEITGSIEAEFVVNSEAAFKNVFGFYAISDAEGGIDIDDDGNADLFPGDENYAKAAVENLVISFSNSEAIFFEELPGGVLLAPVLIANGTPEEFLEKNADNLKPNNVNQLTQDPIAYFPYLGANPDGADHIRLTGDNSFVYEDLYGGGDKDFNDAIVKLNFS
ncbi:MULTISPECIES: DUF4114 domain-containing protein [unclassified Coleofasciculus]|uniref:DUF4114 domain-containing protein n=1 Tax=unclassified Coleofasciculus TaxID=2692782 RepID=UPI001881076C|nr:MULTISPECIES: DUF4114 domain-containing protein [unclassified Coleofasciculus]MBE9129797.1 DUF4114 domain-containing protein [Coleofasciculus sp. LEGE 07081]MBE9152254.1 DUF4114 domain-containing protein [Coleofasciculus sp. LEGE 07092]